MRIVLAITLTLLTGVRPARAIDATWSIVPSPNADIGRNFLTGVAAISPSNAWAVGFVVDPEGITFLREHPIREHWDGVAWSVVPGPAASGALNGVAAVSATDVWAVGTSPAGTLTQHWDGSTWSIVPSPSLGIAGSSSLKGVAALSAADVWAVGSYSTAQGVNRTLIEHWNGASWSTIPSPTPAGGAALSAVAAISPTDVWAVGSTPNPTNLFVTQTLIEHWDGTSWSVVPSPSPDTDPYDANVLTGVSAVAAGDVWAVGYTRKKNSPPATLAEHWNGSAWSIVPSPDPGTTGGDSLQSVAALSASDVWAVGQYALNGLHTLTEHWNGASWSVVPSPSPGAGADPTILNGVAGVSANDVWAVGVGTLATNSSTSEQTLSEHWDGGAWSATLSPNPGMDDNAFSAVAVISATDAWAVGQRTLYQGSDGYTLIEHWNGTGWGIVPSPNPAPYFNRLEGVAAVSPNDIWAVGYSDLLSEPGTQRQTLVVHWDGTSWNVIPSPSPHAQDNILQAVAAISSSNVWAVGYYNNGSVVQTLIEHWDGTSWSVIPSPNIGPTDDRLSGVTAVSATDVWAVGRSCQGCSLPQPLIEHWDGTAWSVVAQPLAQGDLRGVVALAANDVWAVGTGPERSMFGPLTEHWDGSTWHVVSSPDPGQGGALTGVAARSAGDIWAVGWYTYLINSVQIQERLIEHWDGTGWRVSPSPNPGVSWSGLSGVATDPGSGNVWAVGTYSSVVANRTLVEFRG